MEDFILNFTEQSIYIVIFILMFTNGLLSFPPSEITLSLSGIICFNQNKSIIVVLILGVLGNFFGTIIWFYIGKYFGLIWIDKIRNHNFYNKNQTLLKYIIPTKNQVDNLSEFIKNKNHYWIGIIRCVPLIRSIISLPAGMIK